MSALIIIGLIAGVPLLYSLLFRVNATVLFISVVGGNLLAQQFSDDVSLIIGSFIRSGDSVVIARMLLQFVPIVLMLLLARRTVGKGASMLHIVPLIFTCAMIGIFALSFVPGAINTAFYASSIGVQIRQAESIIIGAAVVSQLLLIWSTQRPEHHKSHRGKHH
jgi:hypothetical protein